MASIDWDLLSSYMGLLTLATGSIYAGSLGSVKRDPTVNDRDTDERVSSEDAWLFPLIASVALLGLWAVVTFLGREWINWFLGLYFSLMGVGSVSKSLISLTRFVLGNTRWKQFDTSHMLLTIGRRELISLSWKTPAWFLCPLGALPSIFYVLLSGSRKSALLTDILSLSFSHSALSLIKIDSFSTGCILLSGLFFYDIGWVFGTEVMIKVATTLDAPIKILWPKSLVFSDARGFTLLGLGDIVIPGLFIALALRYDHHHFTASSSSGRSFTKPYFYAALVAYVAGLALTMSVMHFFGRGQPALLYLSPACMLSFFGTALVRGELKEAWDWSDNPAAQKAAARNGGVELVGNEKSPAVDGEQVSEGEDRSKGTKEKTL